MKRPSALWKTRSPAVASTPLENLSSYFADEPAIRFSGWDGRSLAGIVAGFLDLPADQRRALGRAAATRVAARLDWSVVAAHAVDFVEATTARRKAVAKPPDGFEVVGRT